MQAYRPLQQLTWPCRRTGEALSRSWAPPSVTASGKIIASNPSSHPAATRHDGLTSVRELAAQAAATSPRSHPITPPSCGRRSLGKFQQWWLQRNDVMPPPRSKGQTALDITTKVGRHIVHGRTSAWTGSAVKKSRSNHNPKPRVRVLTLAMGMGRYAQQRECACQYDCAFL